METNTLTHWGIKGMKWGVRRFQNKDGSLTPAGKKRYDGDGPEETKEEYEARKQKALKSGNATEVLKFKGDLTQQEMQSALSRIQWEQNMQSISAKELEAGKNRADDFFKGVDKAVGYANTTAKAWNTVANVVNAFGGLDVQLPKIDTDVAKGNRVLRNVEKKKKKEEKEAVEKKSEEAAKKRAEEKKAEDEAKAAEKAAKQAEKEANKVHTGKVTGEGTSKGSQARKQQEAAKDYVDAEWRDVDVSSTTSSQRSAGESYVKQLSGQPLALPAPKDED